MGLLTFMMAASPSTADPTVMGVNEGPEEEVSAKEAVSDIRMTGSLSPFLFMILALWLEVQLHCSFQNLVFSV